MYCPLCGNKLVEIAKRKTIDIDWSLPCEVIDKLIIDNDNIGLNKRVEFSCIKGCFGIDYPLYFHNPYGGLNSEPGESWSLSWIK